METDTPPLPKTNAPVMSVRGVTNRFPAVLANDAIDLDIYAGEIHALLGENGAGKSTLMKILYGFYRADAGEIALNGSRVQIASPADARRLGIGMLFQDFSLIPALSVAENIALFLADLPQVFNLVEVEGRIQALAERYGLDVRPQARVADLPLGEQQKAEILKLLLSGARILILDEPTRVLAPHEIEALYRVLAGLRADGYAIILITHKMNEVLDCADRITILRGGRVAATMLRSQAGEKTLLTAMFGRELSALECQPRRAIEARTAPLLELRRAATKAQGSETALQDIDLCIYPGEIVGVAGISGNGQKELGDLALGMIACAAGEKLLFGKPAGRISVRQARRQGVAFIPENPLAMASIPWMTVLENFGLTRPWRYARHGGWAWDWNAVRRDAQAGLAAMGCDLPLYAPARSLSGGNLQRMVIIRELALGARPAGQVEAAEQAQPGLILASYLTRGLDVQSTLAARQALLDARAAGAGVLLISEDLEELFTLSDRLIVLYEGRIVGEFRPEDTDIHSVGYLMTGSKVEHGADR